MHAQCDRVWIRKECAYSSVDQERAKQTIAGKAASGKFIKRHEETQQQQQQQHHLRSAEEYSNTLRKHLWTISRSFEASGMSPTESKERECPSLHHTMGWMCFSCPRDVAEASPLIDTI